MDPNAALKNIREAVGELRQQDDDGVLDGTSQVGFLLESFEALDEWLTKGGFLPDAWQATRTTGEVDRIEQIIYEALTHMEPTDALDITAHDIAADVRKARVEGEKGERV